MPLKDAAIAAQKQHREKDREDALRRREESFEKIRWDHEYSGFGRLARDGYDVGPMPDRSKFEWLPYPGLPAWGGGRISRTHGWKIVVDDVPFLFGPVEGSSFSLFLIHSCPQCGVEGASTFFDLAELGRLIEKGPKDYAHKCRERETRDLAYAIASAARELKMAPETVVSLAFSDHADAIARWRG
jgi:hypothetical protein